MRRAFFVLLVLAVAPPVYAQAAGAGDAAAGIMRSCAGSADPALDGLEALESACPELRQALLDSGYLAFVSPADQQTLTPAQLIELQGVLERYREPRSAGIEIATLDGVLRSLQQPTQAERPQTWLERLKKWLQEMMDHQSDSGSWLQGWLDDVKVSAAVSRAIVNVSIVLVIVLALAAVINELRVAGLLRRRRTNESADQASGGLRSLPVGADGADIDATSAAARAPLLLRELVATLVRTGRLTAERSLTHRELALRAAFDADDERECFQRVARLAERVVYGGNRLPQHGVEQLLEAGRALNVKLGGAA